MVTLRERKRPVSPAADSQPDPPKKTRARKGKAAQPISDDDDEDDAPSKKKTAATKTKGKKAAKAEPESDDDDNKVKLERKATEMNATTQYAKAQNLVIPVDERCPLFNYHVYVDSDDGIIYDAALNQTNAGNNNNKFYKCQVLTNGAGDFRTWTRWGRVGENGQTKELGNGGLEDALVQFDKKFKDKTGLSWADRGKAAKKGKYTFIERSYEPDSEDEDDEDGRPSRSDQKGEGSRSSSPTKCTLDVPVKSLMELIFNQSHMDSVLADMNYDAKKLPLGKLSKNTITRGYQALKNLSDLLNDSSLAQSEYDTTYHEAVEDLSNQYYSYIPHAFGRNRPPVISSQDTLRIEVALLESLTDLKDADTIVKGDKNASGIHPLNARYNGLNMREMSPVDRNSDEFTHIGDYLTKTRGATHGHSYDLLDVFRIERDGETERFQKYSKTDSDRRLLWHGSRSTNYGGILSQGLRIAPPEAPVSGYMFGKGVYLADMSSKSANYCRSSISGGHALLLLCEAELGNPMNELTDASYTAGEDAGKKGLLSTWGKGQTGPTGWKDAGCIHPSLAGVKMPDTTTPPGNTNVKGAGLYYNEFICYDVAQIRLRYLLRVKM